MNHHSAKTLFEFAAKGMKAQAEIDKLCHANDPETSRKAAEKIVESGALTLQEQEVYNDISRYVIDCCHKDYTPKEIARWLIGDETENYHRIERRQSGLLHKGKIERTGEKRESCMVWKLKE